jgi:glycosyltransferase involved in cell wall biosynthesis
MIQNKPPLFYIVDWLPPDFGAVGQYGIIFARELAQSGRKVYLIGLTTGTSSVEGEAFPSGGILEINRINAPQYNKQRNVKRLLWTFRTNFLLIHATIRKPISRHADVLFTGAPPFMLFFTVVLKVLRRVRLIYRITDFYPEVIIAERGKASFALGLLQHVTWFLRRRVNAFEALGEDQRQLLIRGGVPAARISVKRDRSPITASDEKHPLPHPPELTDRQILLYSGNYGVPHDVDTVVAGLVRHHRYGSARFGLWLNASGRNVDSIVAQLTAAKVPFAFTKPLPLNHLASLLAVADVHLITLRPSFSGIVLPSKVYACIESGRPILYVGPASSDVHLLCTHSKLPYTRVEPGDFAGFAEALECFAQTPKGDVYSIGRSVQQIQSRVRSCRP